MRQGAPQATQAQQIADRWRSGHLLHNLGERVEAFLREHKRALKTPRGDLLATKAGTLGRSAAQEAQAREEHRRQRALYTQVQAAKARGLNPTAIAKLLGISRQTAYKYAAMTTPPDRLRLLSGTLKPLAAYVPYLYQRWNEGCRTVPQRRANPSGAAESSTLPSPSAPSPAGSPSYAPRTAAPANGPPSRQAPVPSPSSTVRTCHLPPHSRPAKGQSCSPKPLSTSRSDNGITWRRSLHAIQRYARSMSSCKSSAPWSAPEAERTWTGGWSVWRLRAVSSCRPLRRGSRRISTRSELA